MNSPSSSPKPVPARDMLYKYYCYIAVAALISTVLSVYLLGDHINDEEGSFCDMGELFSCTKVRRSKFSELFGVPIATFGILYNVVTLLVAIAGSKTLDEPLESSKYTAALFYWSLAGTGFVFYLIFAECIIGAICPVCTLVHVIHALIQYFSYRMFGLLSLRSRPSLPQNAWDMRHWFFLIGLTGAGLILVSNVGPLAPIPLREINNPTFPQCVTEKGWVMLGLTGCSWCQRQKLSFGNTFEHIRFIDCHIESCEAYKLTGYPTWLQLKNDQEVARWSGFASPEDLQLLTGCVLD